MLRILKRFDLGDAGPIYSILDVAKYGSSRPVVVPLEPDTVRTAWDNEVVDLRKGSKFVLKGVIGKG